MNTETINLISNATSGTFDLWRLAGKSNRFKRQAIMSSICGRKVTQSQSGVNAIRNTLMTLYQANIGTGCLAVREERLTDTLKSGKSRVDKSLTKPGIGFFFISPFTLQ